MEGEGDIIDFKEDADAGPSHGYQQDLDLRSEMGLICY